MKGETLVLRVGEGGGGGGEVLRSQMWRAVLVGNSVSRSKGAQSHCLRELQAP